MCGIAGVISTKKISGIEEKLFLFQKALKHRGPDGDGFFISKSGRAGFAHTRLAIQDLSLNAQQPMSTEDGRYTIIFNGEIYNFKELRSSLILDGESFFSESDTEVILKLYKKKGHECLGLLQGMFAFAIWDNREENLFLARDRFGIKPLYFSQKDDFFAFSSELTALAGCVVSQKQLSAPAVKSYLLKGSVREPGTILTDVEMLPAATYLIWRNGTSSQKKYWKMESIRQKGSTEAVSQVRKSVMESVQKHLVSDVPVGVFLSGGIDSTVMALCAVKLGMKNMHSFSIGFENKKYDESERAKKTAAYLGLHHHEQITKQDTAVSLYKEYLQKIDQPTIDGFNVYCVSKFAVEHGLKVILSGLGGDELFGGYNTFQTVPFLFKLYQALGAGTPLGRWLSSVAPLFSNSAYQRRISGFLSKPEWFQTYLISRGIFSDREVEVIFKCLFGDKKNISGMKMADPADDIKFENDKERIAFYETSVYMRDQLLRDADVMGMACGLELRVPFVDHILWESVSTICADMRLNRKQILIRAFPEIPDWIKNHSKQGFSFPFEDWTFFNPSVELMQKLEVEGMRLKAWYQRWALSQIEYLLSVEKRKSAFGSIH